jgi:hypothetical protein
MLPDSTVVSVGAEGAGDVNGGALASISDAPGQVDCALHHGATILPQYQSLLRALGNLA